MGIARQAGLTPIAAPALANLARAAKQKRTPATTRVFSFLSRFPGSVLDLSAQGFVHVEANGHHRAFSGPLVAGIDFTRHCSLARLQVGYSGSKYDRRLDGCWLKIADVQRTGNVADRGRRAVLS